MSLEAANETACRRARLVMIRGYGRVHMRGRTPRTVVSSLVLFFTAAHLARAGVALLPRLPEGGRGIAAKYLGDRGIARDPAVVFHDDFEACSATPRAEPQLRRKWDMVYGTLRIADEAENVHGGKRSLEMAPQQAKLSVGVGKNLEKEQDVLFLRWYTRFDKGFDSYPGGHNGASISSKYHAGGRSTPGIRADGRNKFLVEYGNWRSRAETKSPGPLFIYCYHPEQRNNYGDHIFPTGKIMPRGRSRPFGKDFVARPDVIPGLGRWYCYEFMLKANTPGKRDGRIACWLDGKLVADFPGMRLRDVDTLTIDRFGLGIYLFDNRRENRKWSDDIVAATSYIGPMRTRAERTPSARPKPRPPRPPRPVRKKASDEAVARYDAELIRRVSEEVDAGRSVRFSVTAFQQRFEVMSIDEAGTMGLKGAVMKVNLEWPRLELSDRRNLALALLREGDPADRAASGPSHRDHCLAAFYLIASGDEAAGEEHLTRGGEGAAEVAASFTLPAEIGAAPREEAPEPEERRTPKSSLRGGQVREGRSPERGPLEEERPGHGGPADLVKLYRDAETYFIDGDFEKARELFERIVREHPESDHAGKAREYLEMLK